MNIELNSSIMMIALGSINVFARKVGERQRIEDRACMGEAL